MSHEYAMCLFLWTHKLESWDSSLMCQKFLQNCFYQKITININCQQNINRNYISPQIITRKCNMMRIFHQRLQDFRMSSTHLLLFLIFLQYIVGCYIICLLFPLSSNHLSTTCFILTEFASSLFKERQTEGYKQMLVLFFQQILYFDGRYMIYRIILQKVSLYQIWKIWF